MTFESRLFINGSFSLAQSGQTFEIFNPATEDKVGDVHLAGPRDVDLAVEAASKAFPAWSATPAHVRADCIRRLAGLVAGEAFFLAELDSVCMGRPVHGPYGGKHDGSSGAVFLNYWAGLAENVHGETSLNNASHIGLVLRHPFGVCAAITPWNVPILMFLTKVAPCILAGNTIVLKPSEKSPLSALHLALLCNKAGIPAGVVNVVPGLGNTGALLAQNMAVRKISFTGSTSTGRAVQTAATNSNLKNCQLELGGKSAGVIWSDADLRSAVNSFALSFTWNSGQLCSSTTRLYVHQDVYDAFTRQLKEHVQELAHVEPGSSNAHNTHKLGPQADAVQGEKVGSYLESGRAAGRVLVGGRRVGKRGWFIEPTILLDVPEDAQVNLEEIFGPVVIVHKIKDEDEALKLANASEYGLFGTIFTKDLQRAFKFAKRLEAGSVGVNVTSPIISPDLPAGGFKSSGIGREYGPDSVLDWTEVKTVFLKSKL